jgi:hypothetical protein
MTPRQLNLIMSLIQRLISTAEPTPVYFGGCQPTSFSSAASSDRGATSNDEILALNYCQLVLSRFFKQWGLVEDFASQWIQLAEVHRLSGGESGTRVAELFYINALIQLGMATREQRMLDRSERMLQHAQELCLMRLLHAGRGTSPTSVERDEVHTNEEFLDFYADNKESLDMNKDDFSRKILHLYLSSCQQLGRTQSANSKPDEAIESFSAAIRTWNTILSPLHTKKPACQCCTPETKDVPLPKSKPGSSCLGLQYNLYLLSLAHKTKAETSTH